jgi:hypothetical protein
MGGVVGSETSVELIRERGRVLSGARRIDVVSADEPYPAGLLPFRFSGAVER